MAFIWKKSNSTVEIKSKYFLWAKYSAPDRQYCQPGLRSSGWFVEMWDVAVCCSEMLRVRVMLVQWQTVRSIISPTGAPSTYLPPTTPPSLPPPHPPLSLLSSLSPSNQFQHLQQYCTCTEQRSYKFFLNKFNLFAPVDNNTRIKWQPCSVLISSNLRPLVV